MNRTPIYSALSAVPAPYHPHTYGSSSALSQEMYGDNAYLEALADPWNHQGQATVPDGSSAVASHTKHLTVIANLTNMTHSVLKISPFQQDSQLTLGAPVINPITNRPGIGWRAVLPFNESLHTNYALARLVAAGTKVTSFTIPSGQFAIMGQIIAANFQSPVDFSRLDVDSLTSYNSPNTVNNRSILEGIVSLAIPNSRIDFLPVGSSGADNSSSGQGFDEVQTFKTPLFPSTSLTEGFNYDSTFSEFTFSAQTPARMLLKPGHSGYVKIAGTVNLQNVSNAAFGTSTVAPPSKSYSVTVRVYYLDSAGNMQLMPGTSNMEVAGRHAPAAPHRQLHTAASSTATYQDTLNFETTAYCEFPIANIEVSLKEGDGFIDYTSTFLAGSNTFPFMQAYSANAPNIQQYNWVNQIPGQLADVSGSYFSVTVTQIDYHNPMKFPTSLLYFSDLDPNATLNLTGRWIYECVPDANLQRQITAHPSHTIEMSDFAHALYYMNSGRTLFTIDEYKEFLAHLDTTRNVVASSSFWGDVWRGAKKVARAVGRPVTNLLLNARAPHLLGPANAALDSLGFSTRAHASKYVAHSSSHGDERDSLEPQGEVAPPLKLIAHSSSYEAGELDIQPEPELPAPSLSTLTTSYFSYANLGPTLKSLSSGGTPLVLPPTSRSTVRACFFPMVLKTQENEVVKPVAGVCVISKEPMGGVTRYGVEEYREDRLPANFRLTKSQDDTATRALHVLHAQGLDGWYVTLFVNGSSYEERGTEIIGDSWLGALSVAAMGLKVLPMVAASVSVGGSGEISLTRVGDIAIKADLASSLRRTLYVASDQPDAGGSPTVWMQTGDPAWLAADTVRAASPLEVIISLQMRALSASTTASVATDHSTRVQVARPLLPAEGIVLDAKNPVTQAPMKVRISPASILSDREDISRFAQVLPSLQREKLERLLGDTERIPISDARIFLGFYLNKATSGDRAASKEKAAAAKKSKAAAKARTIGSLDDFY